MEPASVLTKRPKKFYSPLRYPGGKAILSEFLFEIIDINRIVNCTYVEPFAGGAGAALTLLLLEKVERIVINDRDPAIYAFWRSILDETERFIEKINLTNLCIEEWHNQKSIYVDANSDEFDLGFATFFLNRTNRSGIIGGRPIGGLEQDGKWKIDARFNKKSLIHRIEKISSYRNRIDVSKLDGIELMKGAYELPNALVYIDPPYYKKGSSLYLNHYSQSDHSRLAEFLNSNPNFYWLLSYDNVPEITNLYKSREKVVFDFYYHTGKPIKGSEIMIMSDVVMF